MLTRKQFLRQALHATGGVLGLVILHGCGGGDDSGTGTGSGNRCLQSGADTTIATNHGHVLVVSADDVAAGAEKTFDMQGSADHTHSVTLTQEHFAQLQASNAIMMTSTQSSSSTFSTHDHAVVVACA